MQKNRKERLFFNAIHGITKTVDKIKDQKRTVFMKDGKIIEQGTHDELMAMKGYYHDLYTQQFKEEMMEELVK